MEDISLKKKANPRRIQSIEIGFKLVRTLEAANGPLPLKDIAAAAGMPPSKAYLYLVSFAREGIVQQDATTGHYGLGPFAVQLGLAAIRQLDVIGLAREELADLRAKTNCAVHLSIWGNRGPVIALKVDGHRQGSMAVRLGFVLPLRSATGQIFLTYLPSAETAAIAAQEASEMRADALFSDVSSDALQLAAEVRRRGFATSQNKVVDFASVSAPIFDYGHNLAAALTVLGPTTLVSRKDQSLIVAPLLEAAGRISGKLGAVMATKAINFASREPTRGRPSRSLNARTINEA